MSYRQAGRTFVLTSWLHLGCASMDKFFHLLRLNGLAVPIWNISWSRWCCRIAIGETGSGLALGCRLRSLVLKPREERHLEELLEIRLLIRKSQCRWLEAWLWLRLRSVGWALFHVQAVLEVELSCKCETWKKTLMIVWSVSRIKNSLILLQTNNYSNNLSLLSGKRIRFQQIKLNLIN